MNDISSLDLPQKIVKGIQHVHSTDVLKYFQKMYVLEQTRKMKAEKRNFRGSQKAPSGLNTESVDSHADSEETIEGGNGRKGGRIGVNEVNRVRSRRSSRVGSVTGEENNENENGKKEKGKGRGGKGKEDKEVEGGEIGEGEEIGRAHV